MQKANMLKTIGIIAIGLFSIAGIALADGEWATSGPNIFNTNSGAVNINSPTGPGSHPLNVGSTGGSNIRLTGRDNGGYDEAAIMFQKYDGSTMHGYIQGIAGKLQFSGGGGTGITVDLSGNVGIGTNNPSHKLHVMGSGSFDGNVGIGTTNPSQKLDVNGYVNINSPTGSGAHPLNVGSTGGSNIRLTGRDNGGVDEAAIMFQKYDGSTFHGIIQGVAGNLQFLGSSGTGLTVNSAGNIGVGTNEPQQKLHVSGNGFYSGNIGIGTIPTAKLDILGDSVDPVEFRIKNSNSSGFAVCYLYNDAGLIGGYQVIGSNFSFPKIRNDIELVSVSSGKNINMVLHNAGTSFNVMDESRNELMTVQKSGNVGIGTVNPQSKLAVNGTITAKKVKVTEVGWSDFVFADDYKLPSLAAVEDHIKKHKHLPGIPSAKEIHEKGLDVSDVLAKQMQKIEELTLYMIEMKKENLAIIKENQNLKNRINAIEKQVTRN